jgi:hypothetical protein
LRRLNAVAGLGMKVELLRELASTKVIKLTRKNDVLTIQTNKTNKGNQNDVKMMF